MVMVYADIKNIPCSIALCRFFPFFLSKSRRMDFVFFRLASPRETADFWQEQRLLAEQIRDFYDRDCEIKWAARREAARLKATRARNLGRPLEKRMSQ